MNIPTSSLPLCTGVGYKRNSTCIQPFQPPRKRIKQEINPQTISSAFPFWQELSNYKDIILKISSYLRIKDLLHLEATHKAQGNYTKDFWIQKKKDSVPNWAMCEKEPHQDKWNVCLTSALKRCVKELAANSMGINVPLAQNIFLYSQGLFKRFPLYGCYVKSEITKLANNSPNILNELQSQKDEIYQLALQKKGGELILQTLFEIHNYLSQPNARSYYLISQYATEAINQKAYCISLFALKLFYQKNSHANLNNDQRNLLEDLSLQAAKKGYFLALDLLLSHYSPADVQKLIDQGLCYAPVLAQQAVQFFSTQQWRQADALLVEAIAKYGNKVPAKVLNNAAYIKMRLKQYSEADALYAQAIVKYGPQVSAYILDNAAFVKKELKQYSEADALYAQAIAKYGPQVPAYVLKYSAFVKKELKQYFEADALYAQAIAKYGPQVPADVLTDSAFVKKELKQYPEADALYAQAIAKYGPQVPADVLTNSAFIKIQLKQYSEGDALYAQAIAKYGPQVPAYILANSAFVKKELKQYFEADALYAPAIAKYGDQVPAYVLVNSAFVKKELKQYPEADALHAQAIAKYGDQVPASVLANSAFVKQELKQYPEADALYAQAIAKYGHQVPADVLEAAAQVKLQLKE